MYWGPIIIRHGFCEVTRLKYCTVRESSEEVTF